VPPWLEDGAVVFDLEHAKYSVSGETSKCLLHLWSEERNIVRRVLDVEAKGETLHVTVQKIGQLRPTELDIHRECDPDSLGQTHGSCGVSAGVRAGPQKTFP
jgi:hypothetical protein